MASAQVDILAKSLKKKRLENPRLSIRWLAQSLDLSAPMMTRVLKGERKLPAKLVPRLGALLDIDRDDQERILKELLSSKGYTQDSMRAVVADSMEEKKADLEWQRPNQLAFDMFKAWYIVAILDATNLKTYDGTLEFLARKLKLEVKVVENAMADLQSAGLLELREGKWRKAAQFLELRSSSTNLDSIRKLHIDQLDKVKQQLQTRTSDEDRSKRLVTGMTFSTSRDKIAVAKIKTIEFLQELTKDLASGEPEEVYHFAVQLYPLT